MKIKILSMLILALALVIALSSCDKIPGLGGDKEDDITISEDGYIIVNGNKTEHKVHTKDEVSVNADGYVVVNGTVTDILADKADVITVDAEGYLVVNGVKTQYLVSNCNHVWSSVTTPPTCTEGGYDTITCKLCDKSAIVNETPAKGHSYSEEYTVGGDYHWFACACGYVSGKELHTADENNLCTKCGTPVEATSGVMYDKSADGTYALVVGYEGTDAKVKIADTYEGLPVELIYDSAFYRKYITDVAIPDSVKTIGSSAFAGCYRLTNVTIPDSVTSIGESAFQSCSSLTSVTIPDSVTSIGNEAFYDCSSLTSVTIGNNVTSIGQWAFSGCALLTSVTIPDSVTSIGNSAFFYCTRLTSVTIRDSVKSIGNSAFGYCSSLTSVTIPDGVIIIDGYAFSDCSNLASVMIPNSVVVIEYGAFSGCNSALYTEYKYGKYVGDAENPYQVLIEITNKNLSTYEIHEDTKHIAASAFHSCEHLTSIDIPDSVTSIDKFAFYGCSSLTSVTIPDSVTIIVSFAFESCSSLTSVTIPDSVTIIGNGAFSDCSNLTDVYYTGSEEQWSAIEIYASGNDDLISATIHYNYVIPEE